MGHERHRPVMLGCDTGEADAGAGRDRELAMLAHATAASIACGGHAGDEESMGSMVDGCLQEGCLIGAHPSYPDRAGFGRRAIEIESDALWASVESQIATLARVCGTRGGVIRFVKPHGALYHACASDASHAESLANITARRVPGAGLVGPAGSRAIDIWRSMGMGVLREGFADRVYTPEGGLRSRHLAGSMIGSPEVAGGQALRMARGEGVVAWDGSVLALRVDMIGVHSDTPGALGIIEGVRHRLHADGLLRAK